MNHLAQPPPAAMTPHRGPLLVGVAIAGVFACAICSPIAFFMARTDRKAISEGTMDSEGSSLTDVAYWVSLIHTAVMVIAMCLGFGFAIVLPFLHSPTSVEQPTSAHPASP